MVEPVPYVFERLRANCADLQGVVLENAAIADRNGKLPFYHVAQEDGRERANLPRWYDGIGSFSREVVLNHASLVPDLDRRLVETYVACLTFDSLCRKHGVSHVDLLLIDTEGYDHEILKNIDWDAHRPRLIVYEHYHLASDERAAARDQLQSLGYEIKEEGFDTWCLLVQRNDQLTQRFRALEPGLPSSSVYQDR
jgi:FkbM family methyltransferase